MSEWEIKVLNGEESLLHHLDDLVDQHSVWVMVALIHLLLVALILVIIHAVRYHAKGRIEPGPRIICVDSPAPAPPPEPEPPFDLFPPMRDVDYEIERLRDEGYLDD